MKKLLLGAISFFLYLSVFAQNQDPRLEDLDKQLENARVELSVPGFAVAIVEKNKIIYAKGFGHKDDQESPVTENTLFAIGSSSKAFTSAVLGVLRADEKIDFDERPAKYIPGLRFSEPYLNEQIIVKDLMSHRTGLPRHDFAWYLFPSDSDQELLARIAHHKPFTGLRQQWFYNNWMFFLQGQIGESITGQTWEQNVQRMFFDKLGMTRSNFKTQDMAKDADRSLGYNTDEKGENTELDYYDISAMAPAGAINSSVTEMSNWLITWINGGKFNDEQVIPEDYVKEAMSAQMVVSAGVPAKEHPDAHFSNYGYGWFLSSYRGHYRVEHGGNIDGFSASASFFPTDSIGVVVLANQNGSALPGVVRNLVADRILEIEPADWLQENIDALEKQRTAMEKAEEQKDSLRVSDTKPSHMLAQYLGDYENPGYGEMELTLENDSLFFDTGFYRVFLEHDNHDVFKGMLVYNGEIVEANSFMTQFTSNIAGDIDGAEIKFEPALDPISFKRSPKEIEVSEGDLKKYEGAYLLMGVQEVKVYIKDGELFAFVPGQPEYELVNVGEHEFNLKILDGYKVKFEEKDGEIIAVNFVQPNGTFRGERKQ